MKDTLLARVGFDITPADWNAAKAYAAQLGRPEAVARRTFLPSWLLLLITLLPVAAAVWAGQLWAGLIGWLCVTSWCIVTPWLDLEHRDTLPEDSLIPLELELHDQFLVCTRGDHRHFFALDGLREVTEREGRTLIVFAAAGHPPAALPVPLSIPRDEEATLVVRTLAERASRPPEKRHPLSFQAVMGQEAPVAKIDFALSEDEKHVARGGRPRRLHGWFDASWGWLAAGLIFGCLWIALIALPRASQPEVQVALCTMFSVVVLRQFCTWCFAEPAISGTPEEPQAVVLSVAAVWMHSREVAVRESWLNITEIALTGEFILFRQAVRSLIIVPVSAFPSEEDARQFFEQAQSLWEQALAQLPTLTLGESGPVPSRPETGNPYQTHWADR